MKRTGLALTFLLTIAACKGDEQPVTEASEEPTAAVEATESPSVAAIEQADLGRDEEQNDDLMEFAYSYPAEAGAIPKLRALLDNRLAEARSTLEAGARSDKREREGSDFPYYPHASQTAWQVVTQTPRWLSLSAHSYGFSGGAHGMSTFDTLLWDREEDVARKPVELFITPAALRNAIREPFCKDLNLQRQRKRGEPVRPGSKGLFDDCIDPLDETLLLGSSNGQTFNRLGILIAPYSAGPYVEGTYEVTLPVTDAVMSAVKPAYREGFSVLP